MGSFLMEWRQWSALNERLICRWVSNKFRQRRALALPWSAKLKLWGSRNYNEVIKLYLSERLETLSMGTVGKWTFVLFQFRLQWALERAHHLFYFDVP